MQKIMRLEEGEDFKGEIGVAFVDVAFDAGEALEQDATDAGGGGVEVVRLAAGEFIVKGGAGLPADDGHSADIELAGNGRDGVAGEEQRHCRGLARWEIGRGIGLSHRWGTLARQARRGLTADVH